MGRKKLQPIQTTHQTTTTPEAPQNTGQTGQTDGRAGRFELAKDSTGEWHWLFFSGNGRPIATNAAGYANREDATGSIDILKKTIQGAQIFIAYPSA